MPKNFETIAVPGGAGYVGSRLVPALLAQGYRVRVLDTYYFGDDGLADVAKHSNLIQIKGDVRDSAAVKELVNGCEAVIHLACIANDPSVELDPTLSRSINYDSFRPFLRLAREAGVQRFIFASSSSVYGVSDVPEVTEDHPHVPVSLYNQYKSKCEAVLWEEGSPDFTVVAARPATICGYSPRQRLDLTVNILTNHAVNLNKITVFGGEQMRPNIHIDDMVDLYLHLLTAPAKLIAGEAFNAGYENHRVRELAEIVRRVVAGQRGGAAPEIVTTPSDDIRSYHISSEKLRRVLGFRPQRTIEDAVRDLVQAFADGRLPDSMTDEKYYNVQRMKTLTAQVAA